MDKDKEIENLVDKYFNDIQIENSDFIPRDGDASDVSYILLNLPLNFLKEYLIIKNQNRELPDVAEFWRDTNFVNKLKNLDKSKFVTHALYLPDLLQYLHGDIEGGYQKHPNPKRIRMEITEIPNSIKN